jgi:hypothetical protein
MPSCDAVIDASAHHVWIVALALAGAAPFAAAAWQSAIERRMRRRTLDVLAHARLDARDGRRRPS